MADPISTDAPMADGKQQSSQEQNLNFSQRLKKRNYKRKCIFDATFFFWSSRICFWAISEQAAWDLLQQQKKNNAKDKVIHYEIKELQ